MSQNNLKTGKRAIEIRSRDLKLGEFLFENGDLGSELYIIESGKLSISQGKGLERIELAQLSSGSMVGEMALFDGAPRSADASAIEPTRLKVITKGSFDKMIQILPVWLKAIINIVVNRIREANSRVDSHSIPKMVFSLISFISLSKNDSQGGASTSFDYFHLQDNFCFFTRAHRDDFKVALDKLYTEGLVDIISEDSGNQTIVSMNDDLLIEISKVYMDFRNKVPILAKEINQECHQAIQIIGELFKQNPEQKVEFSIPVEKFMERLQNKNPRITERAIDPLIKYQIISKIEGKLIIPKAALKKLKLSIQALAKVKGLIK